MFLVFAGLSNYVHAAATLNQPEKAAISNYPDQGITENPKLQVLGVYVDGKLIPIKNEEDAKAFYADKKAYIEKIRSQK